MGTFNYPITIIGPGGEATLEPMVDTGATYSVFPRDILERLGVKPFDTAKFELGDGRIVDYEIGSVEARIDGTQRPTLCVFGGTEVPPLIGAITLEAFLLNVDPVRQRLVPTHGWLVSRRLHSPGS